VDLSIEELIVEAINVYPNPTNGLINIKLSDEFYKSDIQLIDINGKIIASWQSFTNSQLDLSDFAQGVYILEFQGRTEVGRKRLVIE
ncbi:MAG: T9SS type A sorting domain-containing protein, partial [Flavobacteriales bacterium]